MLVKRGPGRGVVEPFNGNGVYHLPCPSTKRGLKRREAKVAAGKYKGCGQAA